MKTFYVEVESHTTRIYQLNVKATTEAEARAMVRRGFRRDGVLKSSTRWGDVDNFHDNPKPEVNTVVASLRSWGDWRHK